MGFLQNKINRMSEYYDGKTLIDTDINWFNPKKEELNKESSDIEKNEIFHSVKESFFEINNNVQRLNQSGQDFLKSCNLISRLIVEIDNNVHVSDNNRRSKNFTNGCFDGLKIQIGDFNENLSSIGSSMNVATNMLNEIESGMDDPSQAKIKITELMNRVSALHELIKNAREAVVSVAKTCEDNVAILTNSRKLLAAYGEYPEEIDVLLPQVAKIKDEYGPVMRSLMLDLDDVLYHRVLPGLSRYGELS